MQFYTSFYMKLPESELNYFGLGEKENSGIGAVLSVVEVALSMLFILKHGLKRNNFMPDRDVLKKLIMR